MRVIEAIRNIDWEYLFAQGASMALGLIICIIGLWIIVMWWYKYNERKNE
jgi:tryptophan-rich sensory protein